MSSDEEYGVKKIKVNIDRSPEVEAIRAEKEAVEQELAEKKAILEQQALEEFEQLKQRLSEKFNDQNILDCGSPSEVYSYIASVNKPQEQKRVPMGKAPMYSSDSGGAKDYGELLDQLYDTAYYNPKATPEERQEAKQKIDQLFDSLISGRSWEQLKRSKAYDAIIKTNVESCPSCGKTLISGARCSCGYDPYSGKHRPKTYQNPLVK